ncbi:uncharacterized protein ppp1r3aa [Odontesthes bonariensis]|uniref:uncharacterized protein ppp1r3aa n=1 Tax=Odontesthes bonariensis TaxID=219752 RepID=UPI003F58C7D0
MEAPSMQPSEEAGVMIEEDEEEKSREQDEGGLEASSSIGSTTEEDVDEDSEPEAPPVVRRKVSFADAFGLNLVSVKEFDNVEVAEPEESWSNELQAAHSSEEFYLSCLFTCPSSAEELEERLQAQMLELESIELLPGTTTIRGNIRVVNLCYSKSVNARMTLDRWISYFDLLAEYVPGSSDRKTDRFTFNYTLVPPFEKEGTRVEFCFRYETSVGTFWTNNKEMNYVLFCHQKGPGKEHGAQTQEEGGSFRSKRSCLRANRNGGADEKTKETSHTNVFYTELEAACKAEKAGRESMDSTEMQSLLSSEEHKPRVEHVISRRRATRLAHVQDYFFQKKRQLPKALPHDSTCGQKVSQHMPAPWGDAASSAYKGRKMQLSESPPVLTYHQIPLLPLDWNNDASQRWGGAEDFLTGRAKMTLSKASKENTPTVNDVWATFPKAADDTDNKETSVSDVWQVFLNGHSCKDHSDVPESEWLQTAALVSPSNDKEPQIQSAARSQESPEAQLGRDTVLHLHTLAACQLLSDTCETLSAAVALNAEDHQPAEACVSSPRDDSAAAQDASQRSQKNSVTDTPQEFSLNRAPPVSEDSVDSPTECHKHAVWERESQGIMGRAEGIEGDEPSTLHTADLVTSSGELETTDMTAMPESPNASAIDRISQGARQDEALSSGGDREVTGTAHNAGDDMLAFRETIRQETKNGVRYDFSTSRQGAEEGMSRTEKKASPGEKTFRPQKTEEISPRCADETQRENFLLKQNSGSPLQERDSESEPAKSRAGGSDPNQTCGENLEQNGTAATEVNENVPSNNQNVAAFKKTTRKEKEGHIFTDMEMIKTLDEQAWQHNDDALQLNSSGQMGSPSFILGEYVQKSGDLAPTQIDQSAELKSEAGEQVLDLNQTERLSCDGEALEQWEINPSAHKRPTDESMELNKAFQNNYNTVRPCPTDKCNPNLVELVELTPTHLREDVKGQKEDVRSEISPEVVAAQENGTKRGISTGSQPETSETIEEGIQEDERVSVGKLKIEATREPIGNVENPQGEMKNAVKEEDLSAEVESSEYKKLSDSTKEPITAENTASLEEIEPGLKQMFVERFGEDLVRRIWEEVFVVEVQPLSGDTHTADEMRRKLTDATPCCHLILVKNSSDTFDSGVFSLTEPETDLKLNLCHGPEKTPAAGSSEYSLKDESQSFATTVLPTPIFSELRTDLDSSARLSENTRESESAQALRSTKDQENYRQIKARSVTRLETVGQVDDRVVAHKESPDQSAHQSHKHLSSSSEKESDSLMWWTILYTIGHITRLLICTLLVSGVLVVVFLYDFPAFFTLYIFSLCWWIFKWQRHQETTDKGTEG